MHPRAADPGLRLAPHAVLLRRSATEIQVGVEPSVVVPVRLRPLLRALADGAPPASLARLAQADGLDPGVLPDLLAALRGAGLLRTPRPATDRAVRLVGAGTLASRTATELVRGGVGTVYLTDLPEHDPGGATGGSRRPGGGRRRTRPPIRLDRVDLLAASLADVEPGVRVRRTRHFVKPEGGAVALTLVVADGPEPDRLVTDLLREHGEPHLLVRSSGDEAVVGPLVVPGSTSCVRCADLARRDADPRWPWLLHQLARTAIAPEPVLLAWAAVTATVHALAFLDGGAPESLGHTLELGSAERTLRLRAWLVHPECPCRWEDDAADRAESG